MGLLPKTPLLIGEVTDVTGSQVTVRLPGGSLIKAHGEGTVGQNVFVRNGATEGSAPTLPVFNIEV